MCMPFAFSFKDYCNYSVVSCSVNESGTEKNLLLDLNYVEELQSCKTIIFLSSIITIKSNIIITIATSYCDGTSYNSGEYDARCKHTYFCRKCSLFFLRYIGKKNYY